MPRVTGVSPDHGPDTGGNNVTITGSGFAYAKRVLFSNPVAPAPATNPFSITDDRTIVAQPAADMLDELVHVNVISPYGNGRTNVVYQYDATGGGAPAPTLSSLTWDQVDTAGGGELQHAIGTDFVSGAVIVVDGVDQTTTFVSSTELTCSMPAHAAGTINIHVRNPDTQVSGDMSCEYWSPKQLALTGYWRANYGGPPWAAESSAGASGANGNLVSTGGTQDPDVGAGVGLGGYTPAEYVRANSDELTNANDISTFVTNAAGGVMTITKPIAGVAATGNYYDDAPILRDSNADLGMNYTSSGFEAYGYSAGYVGVTSAASTGAYHFAGMRWDSSNLGIQVDGNAEVTAVMGATTIMTGIIITGLGYGGSAIDADVLELALIDSKPLDADYLKFRKYGNQRYGISV